MVFIDKNFDFASLTKNNPQTNRGVVAENSDLGDEQQKSGSPSCLHPDVEKAREIALRKLDRKDCSVAEISESLAKKDFSQEVIAEVVDRFISVGLLDDLAFAKAWVENQGTVKKLSARAMAMQLRRKGISAEHIELALADHGRDREYQLALEFATNRCAKLLGLDRVVKYRRLSGALARKGFNPSLVHQVVSQVLAEE